MRVRVTVEREDGTPLYYFYLPRQVHAGDTVEMKFDLRLSAS